MGKVLLLPEGATEYAVKRGAHIYWADSPAFDALTHTDIVNCCVSEEYESKSSGSRR
jgi:hypothetical protein